MNIDNDDNANDNAIICTFVVLRSSIVEASVSSKCTFDYQPLLAKSDW